MSHLFFYQGCQQPKTASLAALSQSRVAADVLVALPKNTSLLHSKDPEPSPSPWLSCDRMPDHISVDGAASGLHTACIRSPRTPFSVALAMDTPRLNHASAGLVSFERAAVSLYLHNWIPDASVPV